MKNSLAALLTIILSGVFYLVCCQVMKAAEKPVHCLPGKIAQSEHCNFSKKAAGTLPKAASINLFECCRLKFGFFVAKLEKNELPQQASAQVNGFFNFPESLKLSPRTGSNEFFYRAPVFESRDLHIKNCVFRI